MIIRPITAADDPAIAAVERIYISSIPAEERKPLSWLRSLPGRAEYRLVVVDAGGGDAPRDGVPAVQGFAILWSPTDPDHAALLEYLAVDASVRGQGVGGQLVDEVIRLAARPLLIEIKSDDADAHRRQRFYERRGAREIVGMRYILPLPGAPVMKLMVAGGLPSWDRLRQWITAIYVRVYAQSAEDPRLGEMFEQVNVASLREYPARRG